MSLQDTILGRVQIFFSHLAPAVTVGATTKLGRAGLRFDVLTIQSEIRRELNGSSIGFADTLRREIPLTQFGEGSTAGDVAGFLIAPENTKFPTLEAYTAKMHERVRLSLRDLVAALAVPPIDPQIVVPTAPLSTFLSNQHQLESLQRQLNLALDKYLFQRIALADITGTLNDVEDRIVARAIIK